MIIIDIEFVFSVLVNLCDFGGIVIDGGVFCEGFVICMDDFVYVMVDVVDGFVIGGFIVIIDFCFLLEVLVIGCGLFG